MERYGDALEQTRQRRQYAILCEILCRCADNSYVERHSGARVTEERACR